MTVPRDARSPVTPPPQPPAESPSGSRGPLIVVVVLLVLAAVAALAVWLENRPGDEPTPTASPAATVAQTPTPSPTAKAVVLNDTLLLDTTEMPRWNDAGTWTVIDDTDAVRACDLPSAEDLGAAVAISRSFRFVPDLAEGDTVDPNAVPMLGINTVAAYPDDAASTQAVTDWVDALAACGAVPLGSVQGGTTWTFSAPDESSPDDSYFDFVGVAAQGPTTTLVAFSVHGQDANYEGDPLATSLEAAIDRLP